VIKNGLRWRDAPREYGPHKTIYNRFIRWSRLHGHDRHLASRLSQPLASTMPLGQRPSRWQGRILITLDRYLIDHLTSLRGSGADAVVGRSRGGNKSC
jgi:hypothetical protein